jgi:hypothetical protein
MASVTIHTTGAPVPPPVDKGAVGICCCCCNDAAAPPACSRRTWFNVTACFLWLLALSSFFVAAPMPTASFAVLRCEVRDPVVRNLNWTFTESHFLSNAIKVSVCTTQYSSSSSSPSNSRSANSTTNCGIAAPQWYTGPYQFSNPIVFGSWAIGNEPTTNASVKRTATVGIVLCFAALLLSFLLLPCVWKRGELGRTFCCGACCMCGASAPGSPLVAGANQPTTTTKGGGGLLRRLRRSQASLINTVLFVLLVVSGSLLIAAAAEYMQNIVQPISSALDEAQGTWWGPMPPSQIPPSQAALAGCRLNTGDGIGLGFASGIMLVVAGFLCLLLFLFGMCWVFCSAAPSSSSDDDKTEGAGLERLFLPTPRGAGAAMMAAHMRAGQTVPQVVMSGPSPYYPQYPGAAAAAAYYPQVQPPYPSSSSSYPIPSPTQQQLGGRGQGGDDPQMDLYGGGGDPTLSPKQVAMRQWEMGQGGQAAVAGAGAGAYAASASAVAPTAAGGMGGYSSAYTTGYPIPYQPPNPYPIQPQPQPQPPQLQMLPQQGGGYRAAYYPAQMQPQPQMQPQYYPQMPQQAQYYPQPQQPQGYAPSNL